MSDVEGYGAYDPTAPEGDAGRSQYVSKKDARIVGAGLVALAVLCYPIFKMLERRAQSSVCATDMGAIANAITQYAVLHDDRFPPVMRTGPNNEPDLGTSGHPYCWASDLVELMNPRASFRCPAATDKEVTWIEGQKGILPLTYGMYEPYGGYLRTIVANPDQTVLVAETSNNGSETSYDPLPFKSGWDGFVVGWNNTNDSPDSKSKFATRLAFPNTSNHKFLPNGEARHEKGIHAINCDGAMINVKPSSAEIEIARGLPAGLWQAPPQSASH